MTRKQLHLHLLRLLLARYVRENFTKKEIDTNGDEIHVCIYKTDGFGDGRTVLSSREGWDKNTCTLRPAGDALIGRTASNYLLLAAILNDVVAELESMKDSPDPAEDTKAAEHLADASGKLWMQAEYAAFEDDPPTEKKASPRVQAGKAKNAKGRRPKAKAA